MKNHLLQFLIVCLLLPICTFLLKAGDTLTVQTFTFEDIYKRRGTFLMPPKDQTFSKILMLYTLKCDPKTPWDKYDCGEWDYLTYNMVYSKTGIYDSTKLSRLRYSFGFTTPDTLFYSNTPSQYSIYSKKYNTTIESVKDEITYNITNSEIPAQNQGNKTHVQFTFLSKDLRNLGMKTGNYQKMQFYSTSVGSTLKNLIIKMRSSANQTSSYFENSGFTTVFSGDYTITQSGVQNLVFFTPFNWSQFQNINIDISYEQDPANPVFFDLSSASNSIYSGKEESFLEFESPNDYIDCGNITELNSTSKVTFEAWVNIHNWSNWSSIVNKGDQLCIQTGSKLGDIYCIVRNPNNTYGSASNVVKLNEWNHIAMVFDGSQSTNDKKLKLFVNGQEITLTYTGQIPNQTSSNNSSFTISSNLSATSAINASIDEVRVWNDALSQETISAYKDISLTSSHPNYPALIGYYNFNESQGVIAKDQSNQKNDGRLIGIPRWNSTSAENIFSGIQELQYVPAISLSKGTYTLKIDSTLVSDKINKEQISIVKYKIKANNAIIDTVYYYYPSGWIFSYNSDGSKADSTFVKSDGFYKNDTLNYYSLPFEVLDETEIGRFITPYGINLSLGPNGFTWLYDVTDYEPLLHDSVDFAAGNLQELIDVKFLFIKGTPPRPVKRIDKLWGNMKSYSYKSLSDNTALFEKSFDLLPDAKLFKIKTRLTGHGHNSNDGNFPHCCEWKDNTHYLYSGTDLIASWHIWQTNDCALNPVFPQGGTWPGSREGWCPGDVVKDNDFEVTNYVKNNKITLDYDITKVPSDNLGMGNGNYVVAMQLFEYGDLANNIDAEIYDVIMPSKFDYYSRSNPICSNPIIVIRNNGKDDLTSLDFEYYVKGGFKSNFKWIGKIPTMQIQRIQLPIASSEFWIGDGSNKFVVNISKPNGQSDLNPSNDSFISDFYMPDLLQYTTKVQLKTNLRSEGFSYKVIDVLGNVVVENSSLSVSTLYEISLNLPQGCYTLEVTDFYNYGLSYWAYPDQGSGYLKIVDGTGKDIKVFNPDFGHGVSYSFYVGSYSLVQEPNLDNIVYLFPNPAENELNISLNDISGNINVFVFNQLGEKIQTNQFTVNPNSIVKIATVDFPAGNYIIQIDNGQYKISKKFIKK